MLLKTQPSLANQPRSRNADLGYAAGVASLALAQVLQWCATREPHERDLDSVELFAGDMAITRNMLRRGYCSVAYDKRYYNNGPEEDLCTAEGFEKALALVLRLRPHASRWAAPVCSTWGFIGRSGTGRRAGHAAGDNNVPRTRYANRMVALLTMLFLVAYVRNVHIWIEQPTSSLMPSLAHEGATPWDKIMLSQ